MYVVWCCSGFFTITWRIDCGGYNSFKSNQSRDFAFVQYLDVNELNDDFEKAMGCVKLRWARGDDGANSQRSGTGRLDPGKWYGLCPIEAIGGLASIVPTQTTSTFDPTVAKSYPKESLHVGVEWYDQYFFLNRFYKVVDERSYETDMMGEDYDVLTKR